MVLLNYGNDLRSLVLSSQAVKKVRTAHEVYPHLTPPTRRATGDAKLNCTYNEYKPLDKMSGALFL